MSDERNERFEIPPEAASHLEYDVVVVGSGVSGAIIAKELARRELRVLVMEAGPSHDLTVAEYEASVRRFYGAASKDNNAPYAANPNAPMPRSWETTKLHDGVPNTAGYVVQLGPLELDSTYTRVLGGTTRHWEGKALRMLPDDFALRSRFGHGRDWPLGYDDLEPDYRRAEFELGVAGEVGEQGFAGLRFGADYVFPMHGMPRSYLDRVVADDLDGFEVDHDGETFTLRVRGTPQARNGVPNAAYDDGAGYKPVGAVSLHQAEMGQRCQGNTNCTPICPVQAKYDARRTLFAALETGRVDLMTQAVASKVHVDPAGGRVTGIDYKAYHDPASPEHVTGTVRGKVFVLAGNAVENARLMLASGLNGSSGLVGRNLMDHAYLLTWGLMPEPVGALRGPLCTSGIEDLRSGSFRRKHAAFRYGIHNDGWGWATGSPYSDLEDLVERRNAFGRTLRRALVEQVSRQVLLACMVEVPPSESNRITVDPRYVDQLGNPKPVLAYDVPSYTLEGAAFARQLSRRLYQRLGAADHSAYDPAEPGWVSHQGEGFVLRGGNHWAGTHVMGTSAQDSVVDADQRSWDHDNLYLVGAGSMASIGTSNTTLTLAALCFRSARNIAQELGRAAAPAAVRTGGAGA